MRARYFFLVALLVAVFGGLQILSHQRHVKSAVAVIESKDQTSQDVTSDLASLKSYVGGHMGTSTELQLKASYDRAAAAAGAAANPASNGAVYAAAQSACSGKTDSVTQSKCVQNYVATHSQPSSNPQAAVMPSLAAYTKSYKSPGWTADSAGLAFLVAAGLVAAGVAVRSSR